MTLRKFAPIVAASTILSVFLIVIAPYSLSAAGDPVPEPVFTSSVLDGSVVSVENAQTAGAQQFSRAVNAKAFSSEQRKNNGADATSAASLNPVAVLTIFSDPASGGTGSSGGDGSSSFGTHAFITIKNVSNTSINVGKFSGIAPGRTMSIGTWGNQSEHKGLWYDLEEYFVFKYAAYPGRISVSYIMTADQLTRLNSLVINNDAWTLTNNCSSFAARAWNTTVESAYSLSAGFPNTPKNLASNIKSTFPSYYSVKYPVPYDYVVYYANGTGSPTRSAIYK